MDTKNIFEEPKFDPNTLANLGPLKGMAGIWLGDSGVDIHPVKEGSLEQNFIETYELQPIDPQTNGPQLFYGLRYHTHIVRADGPATFHDQVGYWLWEPATGSVILTLAIPRAQVAMAVGKAASDARSFTVKSIQGSGFNGILSNPFLEMAFKTTQFEMTVTTEPDGTWSYDQTTTLMIKGRQEPFLHIDRNRLKRIAAPTPNPGAAS